MKKHMIMVIMLLGIIIIISSHTIAENIAYSIIKNNGNVLYSNEYIIAIFNYASAFRMIGLTLSLPSVLWIFNNSGEYISSIKK